MTTLKKIVTFGTLLAVFGTAHLAAGLIVEESFDYTNNQTLSGKNGGSGFAGAWSYNALTGSAAITTNANGVTVGGPGNVYARRAVDLNTTNAGTFYFSYTISGSLLTYPEGTNSLTDILQFRSGVEGSGNYPELFWTGLFYNKDGIRIRVNSSGKTNSTILGAGSTKSNKVYTIVGQFTFNDGTGNAVLNVWLLDPENPSADPDYTNSWASSITDITQIQIVRSDGSLSGGGASTTFGDIRIGTDWNSVTSAIPEPGTAGVILGSAAIAAAACVRRR